MQRVLPALAADAQLDRPDLPEAMKLTIMNCINGPKVNNVLRRVVLKMCNIVGFHHFVVKTSSMGFDSTIVIPCSAEWTPAYTGTCGATSRNVLCAI